MRFLEGEISIFSLVNDDCGYGWMVTVRSIAEWIAWIAWHCIAYWDRRCIMEGMYVMELHMMNVLALLMSEV